MSTKLVELTERLSAVCPIHGVNSKRVISFKDEATPEQRAAAQAIADGFDLSAPANMRPAANDAFKGERELILNRLTGLAVRLGKADPAFEAACLELQEDIIPLDAHPLVLAAPDTDLEAIENAYVQAYREQVKKALAKAPGATPEEKLAKAAEWKATIDKVFK